MSLTQTQQAVLADLFENDPEFQSFATKRLAAAAAEAEKRANALRSFGGKAVPAVPTTGKKRGRPKGSKSKPKTNPAVENQESPAEERPDWKGKILEALKRSKNGLLVSELQAKLEAQGNPIPGGTLNTYLYGMKKAEVLVGTGNRGKIRYLIKPASPDA